MSLLLINTLPGCGGSGLLVIANRYRAADPHGLKMIPTVSVDAANDVAHGCIGNLQLCASGYAPAIPSTVWREKLVVLSTTQ